jgi:hypothetical protein
MKVASPQHETVERKHSGPMYGEIALAASAVLSPGLRKKAVGASPL